MATSTVISAESIQISYSLASSIRASLIQIVYRKSLLLSPEARQENSIGAIVNHMSVDAEMWISLLSRLKVKAEAGKLKKMDMRVRSMNEILAGIKIIKLYGWEDSFRNRIEEIRRQEIQQLKRTTVVDAYMKILYSSATLPMALATFALYSTIGGPGWTPGKMTADIIVVSVALFGMLNRPIGLFGNAIGQLIITQVSTGRVQKFLLADEIDTNVIQRFPKQVPSPSNPNPVAIQLENVTASWSKPKQPSSSDNSNNDQESQPLLSNNTLAITKANRPTLSNISLTFRQGSLTAIVGRVGQGKSSLLSATLGEMYKLEGSISLYGSVAYVPQQAWIIHGTVRDNILFGKPFNQAKYDYIIHAAGLEPDLAMLPAGDMTEIGERGINLSGGQKQRVSMARAAYQEADIYLLDDPLSAVDAHVDQHLWENLIGPEGFLKDKTRVLVTHGIHHLKHVDQIVTLKGGMISETGQYKELLSHRKEFYQLIKEYSAEHKMAKDGSQHNDSKAPMATSDDGRSIKSTSTLDSEQTTTQENKSDAHQAARQSTKQGGPSAKDGELVEKEKVTADNLGWDLYNEYAKAASWDNVILAISLAMVAQAFQVGTNLWLRQWVEDTKEASETGSMAHSAAYYLLVYAFLVALSLVLALVGKLLSQTVAGLRAAIIIHERLLNHVLRLPMSFFDTTPVGRILNRFSSDISGIDSRLPREFDDLFTLGSMVLGTIIVIGMSTPAFLILVPFLCLAYGFIQNHYLKTSSSLKTMYQVTKSPVYSHFSETITGVSSIRIMDGAKSRFIARAEDLGDAMTQ
ncbi:hypothetical protein BGW42_007448, partial [Actinomortierella wolfii]